MQRLKGSAKLRKPLSTIDQNTRRLMKAYDDINFKLSGWEECPDQRDILSGQRCKTFRPITKHILQRNRHRQTRSQCRTFEQSQLALPKSRSTLKNRLFTNEQLPVIGNGSQTNRITRNKYLLLKPKNTNLVDIIRQIFPQKRFKLYSSKAQVCKVYL